MGNSEIELPKNEMELLDTIKRFYYNQDLVGMLKYIRNLAGIVAFIDKKNKKA